MVLSAIGVVLYWRGCWYLLDHFSDDLSIHENKWKSAVQSPHNICINYIFDISGMDFPTVLVANF